MMFCPPDLQLITINTDNVKDKRSDENIQRSRGLSQFCENLLCGEIARQHTWSSKLYFGNSKDHPIAIWLILTISILPNAKSAKSACLLANVDDSKSNCYMPPRYLLWKISLLRQCLMCLSTTQAHPDKERNGDIVKSFLSPSLGTVT